MPRKPISRRTILRGAAGAVIALPLLEAMGCDRPAGVGVTTRAGETTPRRFIAVYIPNGISPEKWWPKVVESETNYELSETLAPLAPVKDDLLVLRGIDLTSSTFGSGDGHREGMVTLLTGSKVGVDWSVNNPSLDLFLADKIGRTNRLPSLTLGAVGGWENIGSISHYKGGGGPSRIDQPLALFSAMFGDPSLSPAQLAALVARRKSVLDRVRGDYQSLKPKISGADRQRIDEHLAAIRSVEVSVGTEIACDSPDPAALAAIADADLTPWFDSMTQLIVLALQCDISRVATLTFRNGGGGESYFPWLGLPFGAQTDYGHREHHEISHFWEDFKDVGNGESKGGNYQKILGWHIQQLGKLVQALKAAPDGTGTLLQNTALLSCSEHSSAHEKTDMPFLLFGQAGGAFKTGRYLEYSKVTHNQLLVSLMNAMGVEGSTYGEPSLGSGPLAKLSG